MSEHRKRAVASSMEFRKPPDAPIEWRTERHFYSMPGNLEMFLAAVCAIQDYYKWLAKRYIKAAIVLQIPVDRTELDWLLPTIQQSGDIVSLEVVSDLEGLTLGDFDQSVRFDPELAYKMSLTTEKHVTQVFGMMIGSDPPKSLPDVSAVADAILPDCDIMVLPFPGSDQLYEFLCNNRPELNTSYAADAFERHGEFALRGRMLIGVRSGLTYLAASAGRAVVEIYPADRHRDWLSKWASPHYQMIYGNPADVSPALVYRAIEALWKKLEQRQRALQVTT